MIPGTVSAISMYDADTNQQVTIDHRDFDAVKAFQLERVKERAGILILEVAPIYKQSNAALGLLSQEESDALKNAIQAIRTQSQTMEDAINAVTWNGQEATRGAACDAIQNIWWSY
jgi:hypothetical protein